MLDLFSEPAPVIQPSNDSFLLQQRALYEQQQNVQNQLAAQQQAMAGLPSQGNPFAAAQPVNNPFIGNQYAYQQQQQMIQQQQMYQQQLYQQQMMQQQQQQQMMQQQQLYQQQMQNAQGTSSFGKVDLVKTGYFHNFNH